MKKQTVKKVLRGLGRGLMGFFVVLSFLALFSARWYINTYGDLGFDSVLYTLLANMNGVQSDLLSSWAKFTLPATVLFSAPALALVFFRSRRKIVLRINTRKLRLFPLHKAVSVFVSIALCAGLLFGAAQTVKLDAYIAGLSQVSTIYEDEYRDPATVEITFPEQKRNLIYIYLESMETSYLSKEQGGALNYNIIPELYTLARENINFSNNTDVGGFSVAPGASWTIGAMVGQTAGIPLKTPPNVGGNDYGEDGDFLPGVTALSDILHENGYYQALMVGSDSAFGGRKQYYTLHNTDRIYDLFTAREDGLIPYDYLVWWGFEDAYLYTYAKQELTALASQEQPFAFTMLTVDTHHIDGYFCNDCQNTYAEQYENVISCASRQVADFVAWIQQQDFYENTTVVVVGDHASMDNAYFQRVQAGDYQRHVYNCFINSAATTENTQNRRFYTYDMFPTTLAVMGCTIEGDRLGLGTNLFSAQPTLLEATSGSILTELSKASRYYMENFFFAKS